MKRRKWKILKISSLLVGGLAIVATPIVSVSCSSSLTTKPDKPGNGTGSDGNVGGGSGSGGTGGSGGGTQTQTISPKINSKINLSGNISSILGLTGNKSEVQEQLQTFVNSDKSIVVSNYNEIKSKGKDVDIRINVTSGDDTPWSSTSYELWSRDLNQEHIKTWNGYNTLSKTKEQNITVDSKKSLKDFLSTNITSIATNANILVSGKTVTLANASPSIDETNGNLLIPIAIQNSNAALNEKETKTDDSKYVISIPQTNLFLNTKTSITATIIDNKTQYYNFSNGFKNKEIIKNSKPVTTTSEFDFDAKFNNSNIKADKMQDNLGLLELTQEKNESQINVYKNIKDLDILKALGWIETNNESKLESHTDGSPIDVSLLKLSDIKSKLNLEKDYIPETIIFNMKQRVPSQEDYNGAYNIEVVGLKHSKDSSELKTMNFYKTTTGASKTTNTLLQLEVPNAYVLDTTVNASNGKFKNISQFAGSQKQFGIGTSDHSSSSVDAIKASLQKTNTWKKFLKKINESLLEWHYQAINGFNITFHDFNWTNENGNLMTFYLTLKPGFKLMQEIDLSNNDKYNTSKAITNSSGHIEFKFDIDASGWNTGNKSAIGTISDKSSTELETWYATHDEWDGVGSH